jgi:hypothetical protein
MERNLPLKEDIFDQAIGGFSIPFAG